MFNTNIQLLLEKKMDRKEFLKTLAIGLVGLTGIGTVITGLTSLSKSSARSNSADTVYGAVEYGGRRI